jgi:hypothetical protein
MPMLRAILALAPLVTLLIATGCGAGNRQAAPAGAVAQAKPPQHTPRRSAADCVLCAETNPLLIVDKDGNANGTLRLRNRGKEPQTLHLNVSDFTASGGAASPQPMNAVITLSTPDSNAKPTLDGTTPLLPGASIDVKVTAANMWQAGRSLASLMNGMTHVVDLEALRYNVPFNVKVDGPTPEQATISFTKGRPAQVALRNDDAITYRFRWTLTVAGTTRHGTEIVYPFKSVSLPLHLDESTFSFVDTGTLRTDIRPGVLTLEHEPDESLRNYPFPVKRYPVTARLSYAPEPLQGLANSFFILIILLLGIATSWLLNFVLPLQKQRVAIKQRIYDLEGGLAGLDEVIDPIDGRLLSQMRMEKKRLRLELRALQPIFPQSAIDLPKLAERVEAFSRRIQWVSTVGELLQRQARSVNAFSIAEIAQLRHHCCRVLRIAAKSVAAPSDVEQVAKHLEMANAELNASDDELTAGLPARLQEEADALRAEIHTLSGDASWANLIQLVKSFESDFPPPTGNPYAPNRREFIRAESAVNRARQAVNFMRLVDDSDEESRPARRKQDVELLKALTPGPDASLRRAQQIVDQAVANIYTADVVEEIKAGRFYVHADPPRPLAYQLTDFSVRFVRDGINQSAVRNEFVYEWTVNGERLPAGDSSITYFFVDHWRPLKAIVRKLSREKTPQRFHVHVRVREAGKDAVLGEYTHTKVELEHTKSTIEAQTWLSVGTLAVTLLIIGFGLASGAEERLRSLDLLPGAIAVFVLGFGADAVKTLIARISN